MRFLRHGLCATGEKRALDKPSISAIILRCSAFSRFSAQFRRARFRRAGKSELSCFACGRTCILVIVGAGPQHLMNAQPRLCILTSTAASDRGPSGSSLKLRRVAWRLGGGEHSAFHHPTASSQLVQPTVFRTDSVTEDETFHKCSCRIGVQLTRSREDRDSAAWA